MPNLDPGSILVMDNWTIHRGKDIEQLVESFDCSIVYLPKYSPDFNPIEFLFSKIKAFVKKIRPLCLADMLWAFSDAVLSVTPQDARNTFSYCGYV